MAVSPGDPGRGRPLSPQQAERIHSGVWAYLGRPHGSAGAECGGGCVWDLREVGGHPSGY